MNDKVLLISKWQLRDGITEELIEILHSLAGEVEVAEKGTLMYRIHLQSRAALDTYDEAIEPPPSPIPNAQQHEVIFIEVYESAEAFSAHVKGKVFNQFKDRVLKFFQPDPLRENWPLTKTEFLTLQSGFIREDA